MIRAVLKREKNQKKVFRNAHMFNHGWWRLAVGGWWLVAIGGWWLVAIGGWRLVIGGWCGLAVVGGWRLVAAGGWRRLPVGGWWSLGAVVRKKKKGCLKDSDPMVQIRSVAGHVTIPPSDHPKSTAKAPQQSPPSRSDVRTSPRSGSPPALATPAHRTNPRSTPQSEPRPVEQQTTGLHPPPPPLHRPQGSP